MADTNVTANTGTGGAKFSVDDDGVQVWPYAKAAWGPGGTRNEVDVAAGKALPVQLRNTSGTEIGTATAPVRIDPTGTTAQPITDNSGSVTIDTPQLASTLGQKTMATSAGVVIASDQSVIPVSDNAGSLTVDFTGQQTQDYDTGVGVVTQLTVGIALPASGGPVAGGTATNPIQVSLANTAANATAVKVDGSAVTQPISAASLPLPSGAATSAKQPALGTAGTASSDVITVQGIASMTALKVDGSAVTQPVSGTVTANIGTTNGLALDATLGRSQGSTTSGQTGPLVQGAVTTGAPTYATAQTSPLSLTTAGALRTDGSAVTQPISAASLPLPSGAATAAKQPALGTAGSASADVITVQGVASMTALKVDGSAVTQPVSGTVTANAGSGPFPVAGTVASAATDSGNPVKVGGKYNSTPPTFTDGQRADLQTDANGFLKVNVAAGGASGGTSSSFGSAVPGTGTAAGFSDGTNMQLARVFDLDSGAGTQYGLGVNLRASASGGSVEIASATSAPAGTEQALIVRNIPSGTQTVSGTVTANAGTGNFANNLAQVNGSTVSTAATGVQKVGLVGNAGATVDSTVAAGSAPTNQVVVGSVYNTTAPAPTNGQAMAIQADQAGNLRVAPGISLAALSVWNSGTALNATQNIFTNSGAPAALVYATQSAGTFSAGAITFEITYDGSTWSTISADAVLDPTSTTLATQAVPYTLVSATNKAFLILCKGAQGLRIKLSTAITGTGTTTPNYALLSYAPVQQTVLGAGSATIGSLAANQSVNVAQMNGVAVTMGNGVAGTGVQRVAIASDNTAFTVNAAQSGTWTVQPGNTANSTPWLVTPSPATSGGVSMSRTLAGASTNATSVKASAGQVYGWYLYNTSASAKFFKLYNKASAPTVGTDTPFMTIPLPATSGSNIEWSMGIPMGTGIAFAITGAVADADTTAVAANDVIVNLLYK